MKEARLAKPRAKRVVRALGDRRIVIESYGRRAPVFVAIAGGGAPIGAWLSPAALRRLIAAAKKVLK